MGPRSARAGAGPDHRRQGGAALLVLLAFVTLGSLAFLLAALNSHGQQQEREHRTRQALARAKEALIAYAVTYPDTHPGEVPGYLPCPDADPAINPEGSADPACGLKNVSVLGRLPWRTLGLSDLRDEHRECLWYAVSGSHKANPKTDMLNWDTPGQLEVLGEDGTVLLAGSAPEERAVAVVFAPGSARQGQDRSPSAGTEVCEGNYSAANYLDSAGAVDNAAVSTVAGALSRFVSGRSGAAVNDRLAFVTAREIFDAVERRADFAGRLDSLARATAECLAEYGKRNAGAPADKRLPWAVPLSISDYADNDRYDDGNGLLSGRVPYRVDTSKPATGSTIGGNNLLTATTCPPSWGGMARWWDNWKDHLFYALAADYRPAAPTPSGCGSECLAVNGSGAYAGVVIFAGKRLAGQVRSENGDRASIANYLEGRNRDNHPNAAGNSDYQKEAAGSVFNDILYCMDGNLGVAPCP